MANIYTMKKLIKVTKKKMVKMNLTIDPEFYELLEKNAQKDYSRVSTWTKQYLMKNLLGKNDCAANCSTKNGSME
jgi:hypothetical protein